MPKFNIGAIIATLFPELQPLSEAFGQQAHCLGGSGRSLEVFLNVSKDP